MRIGTALQDIADAVANAGIDAAVDARDLVLPGAWVTPALVSFDTMATAEATMEFTVYLIARDSGPTVSLDDLGEMLEKLRSTLPIHEATPVVVNLPNHGADALPALQISITARVS